MKWSLEKRVEIHFSSLRLTPQPIRFYFTINKNTAQEENIKFHDVVNSFHDIYCYLFHSIEGTFQPHSHSVVHVCSPIIFLSHDVELATKWAKTQRKILNVTLHAVNSYLAQTTLSILFFVDYIHSFEFFLVKLFMATWSQSFMYAIDWSNSSKIPSESSVLYFIDVYKYKYQWDAGT